MATVEIDQGAGYCFGVEQAIQTAESHLRNGETIYGLGEMVHNSEELRRLHELGMKTIGHSDLSGLKAGRVLIRAHGEPPSTFEFAAASGIVVIDGTCPIVLKLQERVRKIYLKMDHTKEQLVIFGKPEHPETVGLLGQVNGDATVISTPGDVTKVDNTRGVTLLSQTTMDPDLFREVERELKAHLAEAGISAFRSSCTICGQMKKRKPGLQAFAEKHDVLIFVSGKNSSNGKMLYEFSRSVNPRVHWISEESELDPAWFTGADTIGISGATSTSRTQLESVGKRVKNIISSSYKNP
jgi:4-hydroxy-3-methylbut-2-enyl diphosphate reductase